MAGLGALGGGGLLAGKSLAVLGAGLLAGAVGGTALVATGTVDFKGGQQAASGGSGSGLQLVPCPDQGPVIGTIPRDEKVLVTAKSADGGWFQLYWPAPGIERAWTKAGPLQLQGDAASLPVAKCEAPPPATPRPTEEPTPSPTPTPTPTVGPTPTPTTGPVGNGGPRVSGLAATPTTISYDQAQYCTNAPKSSTISVGASDADGIASVTLFFRRPGAAAYSQKPMALSGGKWAATLDTTADNLTTAGQLAYYVIAKDKNGAPKATRAPTSGALTIVVGICANTGPRVTGLGSNPSTIYWNPPVGPSCNASATNITAAVSDVDGIKSVRLYFRFNGGSWQSKPMDPNVLPGRWYANLDTLGDKFPGSSGRIDYYVYAVDKKDLATKTTTQRITVKYCDSPAFFSQPNVTSSINVPDPASGQYPSIDGSVNVSDGNVTSTSQLKVTIYWQLKSSTGKVVLSGSAPGGWDGAFYWNVATTSRWRTALAGSKVGTFKWWAVSVDPYGGRNDSRNQAKFSTPNTSVYPY